MGGVATYVSDRVLSHCISITFKVLCLQSGYSTEFEQRFTSFNKRIGKLYKNLKQIIKVHNLLDFKTLMHCVR